MSIKKWIAGTAVGVMAAGALVLSAPAASAALCGYPPVECPAGDTNPATPEPIGETPREQAQAGMTLPSQAEADATPATPAPAPAVNAIGEAPKLEAEKGDIVKIRVDVPAGVTYNVKVKRNAGVYNFIGTVVGRPGRVTLPSIQFDRSGTYTFALQAPDGDTYYVRVVVA